MSFGLVLFFKNLFLVVELVKVSKMREVLVSVNIYRNWDESIYIYLYGIEKLGLRLVIVELFKV